MKIGDTVVPVQGTTSQFTTPDRKYLVVRELSTEQFMLKDLVLGCYISGFTDEFVVNESK